MAAWLESVLVCNAGLGGSCGAVTQVSGFVHRADALGLHVRSLLPPSHEVRQVCQISITGMITVTTDVTPALGPSTACSCQSIYHAVNQSNERGVNLREPDMTHWIPGLKALLNCGTTDNSSARMPGSVSYHIRTNKPADICVCLSSNGHKGPLQI